MMGLKNRIDHRPGGLNRVFTGEKRSIAGHGITQKPLVGCFLSRLFFDQVEFSLVPDEFLAGALDASGDSNGGTWGELESQIVGAASRRSGVSEKVSVGAISVPPGSQFRFRLGTCQSADTRAPRPSATSQ